jgi:hypothetical protein
MKLTEKVRENKNRDSKKAEQRNKTMSFGKT